MNTREEKKALRAEYRVRRAALPLQRRAELDRIICDEITSLACFRYADVLLTYYPIKGEINISAVAEEALRRGKKVAYPVCDPESRKMVFRFVSDLSQLKEGSYSIPEPDENAEAFCGDGNAICIVPAFTFDREGFRLGYGGGYYDRFLKTFEGTMIGAVYEEFLTDLLPRGYYDIAVDIIITERGSVIIDAEKRKKGKAHQD